MKLTLCSQCGANSFEKRNGYRICLYCGAKYQISREDTIHRESSIEITNDISSLLKKCKTDPQNARRYVNLILDIDPDNTEVAKYK